jgi:hypothetical protein
VLYAHTRVHQSLAPCSLSHRLYQSPPLRRRVCQSVYNRHLMRLNPSLTLRRCVCQRVASVSEWPAARCLLVCNRLSLRPCSRGPAHAASRPAWERLRAASQRLAAVCCRSARPRHDRRVSRRVTGRGHGQPLGAALRRCPVALGETDAVSGKGRLNFLYSDPGATPSASWWWSHERPRERGRPVLTAGSRLWGRQFSPSRELA